MSTTTNRERLRAAITAHATAALREELTDRRAAFAEDETYDEVDAFLDVDDLSDSEPGWREFLKPCRRILIAAGYYRAVSDEELKRIVVSSGIPYAFSMDGVKYTHDHSLHAWIEL